MLLKATAVSPGIAIAPVFMYRPFCPELSQQPIAPRQVEDAVAAYRKAVSLAKSELACLAQKVSEHHPEQAMILSAHQDFLSDVTIVQAVEELITQKLFAPDAAVDAAYEMFADQLRQSKKEIIRQRASDLCDVKIRLLRCLSGVPEVSLAALPDVCIVVAEELFPSDTVAMDRSRVQGIITQSGGATSHTAIIARSYGIPALLGTQGILSAAKDGEVVILDATQGIAITSPSDAQLHEYGKRRESVLLEEEKQNTYRTREAVTKDGKHVGIYCNIGSAEDDELACAGYADGCGLFRTEFMYLSKTRLPDEEEQFLAYKKTLTAFGKKPVILRTLDVGGDKQLPFLTLEKESNPFLGMRGLRLCMKHRELFETQLRAALRASVHGSLGMMLPMVSSLDEIRQAKEVIGRVREELDEKNLPYASDVRIGIMVEVPAIVEMAEEVAKEVDFASVGTNDLCQYLMAADRMNPSVGMYYQEYHPALFRAIARVAKAFSQEGKSLGVCGELAGNPLVIPCLLGLGVSYLSVSGAMIAKAKKTVCHVSYDEMCTLAQKVIRCATQDEVAHLLTQFSDQNKTANTADGGVV